MAAHAQKRSVSVAQSARDLRAYFLKDKLADDESQAMEFSASSSPVAPRPSGVAIENLSLLPHKPKVVGVLGRFA